MIITDYLRSKQDATWHYALQCGVDAATVRLPECEDFSITDSSHWQSVYDRFISFGIKPMVIEPIPNALHDHIKIGDKLRDECIEKFIKSFEIMDRLNIRTVCFNFMAHIGWYRTDNKIKERGGALVTGFDIEDFKPTKDKITEKQLWDNYSYFIKAAVPYAEKYGIRLALHPDDPPINKLGDVSRIMTSYENIKHAVKGIIKSDNLGVTMCQATYHIMGEDLTKIIPELQDKIFFVHFRNTVGQLNKYRETFHDNGALNMAELVSLYEKYTPDVPVRVDHVPTMYGEEIKNAGYDALGRLFAIGYLKGLIQGVNL